MTSEALFIFGELDVEGVFVQKIVLRRCSYTAECILE